MRVLVAETVAMLAIGDGVASAVYPVQHVARWVCGPRVVRDLMQWFLDHPGVVRAVGVAEALAGIAVVGALPSKR